MKDFFQFKAELNEKKEVNEISVDKLARYGKAAAKDIAQKRNKVKSALGQPASVKHAKAGLKAMQGLTKRSRGSDMYVDKMTGRSKVKPSVSTVGKDKQVAREAKVDEVSLDTAKSAYYKRKSQAQGAAAQGSMDYAKKQMAKARKTKAYIDKREAVEEAVDLAMHKKAVDYHAAKAKPVGNRWPKGAEYHDNAAKAHQHVIDMHKKFGADHDGTKDALAAAKAASKKAK